MATNTIMITFRYRWWVRPMLSTMVALCTLARLALAPLVWAGALSPKLEIDTEPLVRFIARRGLRRV